MMRFLVPFFVCICCALVSAYFAYREGWEKALKERDDAFAKLKDKLSKDKRKLGREIGKFNEGMQVFKDGVFKAQQEKARQEILSIIDEDVKKNSPEDDPIHGLETAGWLSLQRSLEAQRQQGAGNLGQLGNSPEALAEYMRRLMGGGL